VSAIVATRSIGQPSQSAARIAAVSPTLGEELAAHPDDALRRALDEERRPDLELARGGRVAALGLERDLGEHAVRAAEPAWLEPGRKQRPQGGRHDPTGAGAAASASSRRTSPSSTWPKRR
jgi:hypothetical protein